jgi:hypothetical protein
MGGKRDGPPGAWGARQTVGMHASRGCVFLRAAPAPAVQIA